MYFTWKQVQLAREALAFSPAKSSDLFRKLGAPQRAEDSVRFSRQRRFGMSELFKFKMCIATGNHWEEE